MKIILGPREFLNEAARALGEKYETPHRISGAVLVGKTDSGLVYDALKANMGGEISHVELLLGAEEFHSDFEDELDKKIRKSLLETPSKMAIP